MNSDNCRWNSSGDGGPLKTGLVIRNLDEMKSESFALRIALVTIPPFCNKTSLCLRTFNRATRSVLKPCFADSMRKQRVATPISNKVYAMPCEGKGLKRAVRGLISRAFKAED